MHTQGKSHRKKVRDQETPKFFCEDCNVTCANQAIFETHIRGKQHAKKREQGEDRVEGDMMNVKLTILFSISNKNVMLLKVKVNATQEFISNRRKYSMLHSFVQMPMCVSN